MNELQIFNNKEFGEIRAIEKNGEPWFVAKDICEAFGETNRNRAMQNLDEDEKGYTQIVTPGGEQQAAIVNEAGLYSMLFAMQPTKARSVDSEYICERELKLKQFKRWVTHEVIPSIRKHGGYLTTEKIEEVLNDPDTIIKLAMTLKEEKAKRNAAEALIEEQKPKVLFADSVVASNKSMLIGELAKIIKQNGYEIGQKRLFEWLRSNGFLCKMGESYNLPTQYAMERKLFEIKKSTVNAPNGNVIVTNTVKVTPHGQIYFVNKFLKEAV